MNLKNKIAKAEKELKENRRKSISNINKSVKDMESFDNTSYLDMIDEVYNLLK